MPSNQNETIASDKLQNTLKPMDFHNQEKIFSSKFFMWHVQQIHILEMRFFCNVVGFQVTVMALIANPSEMSMMIMIMV